MVVTAPGTALAQERFRDEIVVTASTTPITLGSATRTLTVITREQIAQMPVHSAADVLRLASSVDVRARGVRGLQADFAVRGGHFGQTLVLVDGVRLNDSQSGHHNGDIPVPLDAIERIEVLHGPGSSLFGADAFGGTINIITRRDAAPASLTLQGGSFGLVAARGRVAVERGVLRPAVTAFVDRSNGFMFERGYQMAGLSSRVPLGSDTGLTVSYVWKDFGANGFYGSAPSHEWTNQTLLSFDHRFAEHEGWRFSANASYRTHGDHFLFNVTRPGVAENRHRTHAAAGTLRGTRIVGRMSVTMGADVGSDWIRSNNLGDHTTDRVSGFSEWRYAPTPRVQIDQSLRVDRYNKFGSAWSPGAGISWWASRRARVRASASRAFRVPTFTERFYQDPANWASPDVQPETAWAGETGTDLFVGDGLMLGATLFGRLEHDVIDWLRPSPSERWRTYNIRDVNTSGVELSMRRGLRGAGLLQAGYTAIRLRATPIMQLSKYVLDYAPHAFTVAAIVPLPQHIRFAPRVEYKHRVRSVGTSNDILIDMRVGRRFDMIEVFAEGTNLLNRPYQEVTNVPMPGRAFALSMSLSRR